MNRQNEAFNLFAFATLSFNDIDYIRPADLENYNIESPPGYLDNIIIGDDVQHGNQTLDYRVYVLKSPVMLKQWDTVKYPFEIKATSTDPTATDNVFSTIDAGIVCALDATYVRGRDGLIYLDYHSHGQVGSETDVGYVNVPGLPVGGADCAVFEGN